MIRHLRKEGIKFKGLELSGNSFDIKSGIPNGISGKTIKNIPFEIRIDPGSTEPILDFAISSKSILYTLDRK